LSFSSFQTNQTGGQWYSDTSPFSIPWTNGLAYFYERRSGTSLMTLNEGHRRRGEGQRPQEGRHQVEHLKHSIFFITDEWTQ
jgi:hypothetical protein